MRQILSLKRGGNYAAALYGERLLPGFCNRGHPGDTFRCL